MPRIYVPPELVASDTVVLPEEETRRIQRVLRMKPGDAVSLFDGVYEYDCEITSIGSRQVEVRVRGRVERPAEPPVEVVLGQGMPKGEKLEWVIQKAVELGAAGIVPVVMERSVKRPERWDESGKLDRLRRIAVEAARQSGRVRVPEVPGFMDLTTFLESTRYAGVKLALYEGERSRGLKGALAGADRTRGVGVLAGPEGGLTTKEVRLAESFGYITVGLGPRILRTETAGLAALSVIQYELGDLG